MLGCDDTAKAEFLNKRGAKGQLAGPGQSQSNLWFVKPEQLDTFGPAIGANGVWVAEAVKANTPSDPFLFSGYARRSLHISTGTPNAVTAHLEVDQGDGEWTKVRDVKVEGGSAYVTFKPEDKGAWVRISVDRDLAQASAVFACTNEDTRPTQCAAIFDGVSNLQTKDYSTGVLLTRGDNLRTLSFGAQVIKDGRLIHSGYYELTADMQLLHRDDPKALDFVQSKAAVPKDVITSDAASILVVDDAKRRWRLPKTDAGYESEGSQVRRVCREIATERDLLNAHGTVYELPAENAGGYSKMRAIATHGRNITDYVSYRGLLLFSGISADAAAGEHIIKSDDGKVALWAGAVDDLWKMGKPRGHGGPLLKTAVQAGVPSDPYLLRGSARSLRSSRRFTRGGILELLAQPTLRRMGGDELDLQFR